MLDARQEKLGLWSGVGLCVASMVGSGVFLSSAYMSQEMSAGAILLAWVAGAALSLLGVFTYAELARQMPRSGGEYRYLNEFLHPAVAYIAGWASLVVGFAMPAAINALAAANFFDTLLPNEHHKLVAAASVILIALGHTLGGHSSRWVQNALAACQVLLLVGFVCLGIFRGSHSWPDWEPPTGETSVSAFVGSLFYISYAFSGWNTAAYASEKFRDPTRDVGRAMMIACVFVACVYMLINWIFVANVSPSDASLVFQGGEQVTLGHVVTERRAGAAGASFMSVLIIIAFLASMSAVLMIGPHIAAAMASDGALPKVFSSKTGRVPLVGLWFQVAVALVVVYLQDLRQALESVGATLIFFSGLSAVALLLASWRGALPKVPRKTALVAAALFAAFSGWLLYTAFRGRMSLLPWLGGAALLGLLGYQLRRPRGNS